MRTSDGRWVSAYVGLGSNLGHREHWLKEAVAQMERIPGVRIRRTSSVYETEPVGGPRQRRFLNAVVQLFTALPPEQLSARLLAVERQLGRRRRQRWGPRRIDLDLLLYSTRILQRRDLRVPHPRLAQRRFVLEPLVEIATSLRHPVLHRTMRSLLQVVQHQGVSYWRPPLRRAIRTPPFDKGLFPTVSKRAVEGCASG